MTDANYVHYLIIMDRSGSMIDIKEDMEGGFRQYVKDQLVGLPSSMRATLTLHQFDTLHERKYSFMPLDEVPDYELVPRGGTALYDAVGMAVTREGEVIEAMPAELRPERVICVIVTDGKNNSSHEWNKSQISALLARQSDWGITYLGANQDAFEEGDSMGVTRGSTLSYAATSTGTRAAWSGLSTNSVGFAGGQSANLDYTEEQRDEAADKEK